MKQGLMAFGLAFLVSGAGTAALVAAGHGKRLNAAQAGWSLVPIVVAAVAVEAGAPVTMEDLSQRSIPEQFLTADMVTPAEAAIVVRKTASLALRPGDPVLWSNFAGLQHAEARADCARFLKPQVDAAAAQAGEEALADIPSPPPEPADPHALPELVPDAAGAVSVVVAAQDVAAGTVLEVKHLTTASWPSHLVTASWVPPQHLNRLVGLRLDVPLARGDGVWWQMLDDLAAPVTLSGCRARAAEAIHRAKVEAANRLVTGWTPTAPGAREEVKP